MDKQQLKNKYKQLYEVHAKMAESLKNKEHPSLNSEIALATHKALAVAYADILSDLNK